MSLVRETNTTDLSCPSLPQRARISGIILDQLNGAGLIWRVFQREQAVKFNNRKNELVQTVDGRELWISRSVAVAVSILLVHEEQPYVLINQRGPGLPDGHGLWNLPCGYLDFDESTQEAALREVWEECGVNLLPLIEDAHFTFFDKPWDVSSRPNHGKRNVTIHHGLVANVLELPPVTDAHNEPDETLDIRWTPLQDITQLEFAFNHEQRIRDFVEHIAALGDQRFTQFFR